MAQFDVYPNQRASRDRVPYLLDVQSDILDLATRAVIPLAERGAFGPIITQLNPIVTIKTREFITSTADIASIPRSALRSPIANLKSERDQIRTAIDLLVTGV